MTEVLMHIALKEDGWEFLKKTFSNLSSPFKILSIEDDKQIIIAEIENTISLVGYDYPAIYSPIGDEFTNRSLYKRLDALYKRMTTLIEKKKLTGFKILIVTPFKLSSYPCFDFDKLPTKYAGYMHLSDYPNFEKYKFDLKLDVKVLLYMNQVNKA